MFKLNENDDRRVHGPDGNLVATFERGADAERYCAAQNAVERTPSDTLSQLHEQRDALETDRDALRISLEHVTAERDALQRQVAAAAKVRSKSTAKSQGADPGPAGPTK